MKNRYELPFIAPEIVCEHYISLPYCLIKSNCTENMFWSVMMRKYVNVTYYDKAQYNKFLLDTNDHWWNDEKVIIHQAFSISKNIISKWDRDILTIIKSALLSDCYVCGRMNRHYFEQNFDEKWVIMNYMLTGYDDNKQVLFVKTFDANKNFVSLEVDYCKFVKAIYDFEYENLDLNLRKYNKSAKLSCDLRRFRTELQDYISSSTSKKLYTKGRSYGLQAIADLKKYFENEVNNSQSLDMGFLGNFIGHKIFMKKRIEYLVKNEALPLKFMQDTNELERIGLKISELAYKFNKNQEQVIFNQISELIKTTVQIEKEYFPQIISNIKE